MIFDKLMKLTKVHPTEDEIDLVKLNNRIQAQVISKLFIQILDLEGELAIVELQLQEAKDLIVRLTKGDIRNDI